MGSISESNTLKVYETFDEMGLNDNLLRGIYSYGYERPSKIQQLAIVPIKEHNDILAQAQSGTGKSCSFIVFTLFIELSFLFTSFKLFCRL